MIVLDTSALSMVFRRTAADAPLHPVVSLFRALVTSDEELQVPGVVYQEILSGVKSAAACAVLEEALSGFPLLLADQSTHLSAARVKNQCRAAGIAAATLDCLICAHALQHGAELLTLDGDFEHMSPIVGLRLFAVPG